MKWSINAGRLFGIKFRIHVTFFLLLLYVFFSDIKEGFGQAGLSVLFVCAIKGVEVVVLFKENLGSAEDVRVNLRSSGTVDVNKIASFFGGGGHKTAAGCTLTGGIRQVEKKVLRKIKENF